MRKQFLACIAAICFAASSFAQTEATAATGNSNSKKEMKKNKPQIGLKAGYNYAYLAGSAVKNFDPGGHNGFMVAAFYSPRQHTGLGYRTELIFSRQGFSYDESGRMQNVSQDYIFMPHFTTISIGKFFQIQIGAQAGYLLSAKKKPDDGSTTGTSNTQTDVTGYMDRFDYGLAGGVEICPVAGLLLGARYNISLGNPYKQDYSTTAGTGGIPMPYPFPFDPSQVKNKNAVVQLFVGYKF
jgi:Outer membrane protein beta-barrel domain